jgi:hypothetical protein
MAIISLLCPFLVSVKKKKKKKKEKEGGMESQIKLNYKLYPPTCNELTFPFYYLTIYAWKKIKPCPRFQVKMKKDTTSFVFFLSKSLPFSLFPVKGGQR